MIQSDVALGGNFSKGKFSFEKHKFLLETVYTIDVSKPNTTLHNKPQVGLWAIQSKGLYKAIVDKNADYYVGLT